MVKTEPASQTVPCSLYSALLLTSAIWALVKINALNRETGAVWDARCLYCSTQQCLIPCPDDTLPGEKKDPAFVSPFLFLQIEQALGGFQSLSQEDKPVPALCSANTVHYFTWSCLWWKEEDVVC